MEPTFHMPSNVVADRVQQIVDLVSAGLAQSRYITSWPATPDTGRLGYQVASSASMTAAEVRQTWSAWILANGFRDLAERLGESLELARAILAQGSALRGHAKVQASNLESDRAPASRFHGLGFPRKLEYLQTEFEFSIPANFKEYGLSINAVRNCLVHRNGLVQEKDLKGSATLALYWQPLKIVAVGTGGERVMKLGQTVQEGEKISLVNRRQIKEFALDARIELTSDEFAEVAWTVFRFASVVDAEIETWAKQNGMSIVASELATNKSTDAT